MYIIVFVVLLSLFALHAHECLGETIFKNTQKSHKDNILTRRDEVSYITREYSSTVISTAISSLIYKKETNCMEAVS